MRGLSRDSFAAVEERFNSVAATADLMLMADELFAVADLVDREHSLRRNLVDQARPAAQKAQVARVLLEGKVGTATLATAVAAVEARWVRPGDLADALERLGVVAAATAAEADGQLDDVENALFRFGRILEAGPELRLVLGDPNVPADRKRELLNTLLAGKVVPVALLLIAQVVVHPRGRNLGRGLETYAELVAELRRRLVAVVRSATALSEEQRRRVVAWLSSSYGRDVHLNVEVDPRVIGGFSIRIGDDLIDMTVVGRIDDVRRRLVG